jgi:hypothetical protein
MANFARFVVRPGFDGGPIVGIDCGLMKPGMIYEVSEVLGELVVRECGPGALALDPSDAQERFGFSNAGTFDDLYSRGGAIVRTVAELKGTNVSGEMADALVAIGPETASCVSSELCDGLDPVWFYSWVNGVHVYLAEGEPRWSHEETSEFFDQKTVPPGRAVTMSAVALRPFDVVRTSTQSDWILVSAPGPGPRRAGDWIEVVARRRKCSTSERGYAVIWVRYTEGK